MAYYFRNSDTSARKAVRRIVRDEIDAALGDLRDSTLSQAAMVHSLRKRTKKLRGVLRLIQPAFPGFARENAAFGDAARSIAELRDAQVMRNTFESVAAACDAQDAALAPFRADLDARVAAATRPDATDADLSAYREMLLQARDRVDDWKLRARGFDLLAGGILRTWSRAQKAQLHAAAQYAGSFDAAPFHDWRKPVKAHWYQARLLTPVWPEMMAPHIAAVDALGELLGDHNDRDVLVAALTGGGPGLHDPGTLARLNAAALAQRRVLAGRALVLGQRLLAGSGDDLTARWRVWWQVWRGNA